MAIDLDKISVEIVENAEDSDICSTDGSEATKKSHRRRKKGYVCLEENCSAVFNRRDRLQNHARTHTGERPFVCLYDECQKSYTRDSHLKRHVQKVHAPKNDILLRCTALGCKKQFKTQLTLNNHLKNIHEKRKYMCKTCLKPFRKHQHLKIHEYEHTGIKPFPCSHEGCDKSFILPSKLKLHMKVHAGYKCDAFGCDASFPTWTLLLQHRKAYHPTTYSCDTCIRKFNSRYNLQLHLKIHDEERETYHCPHSECPRYYLHKQNLLLHVRSYHDECEFHCTVNGCKARYRHKVSLKKHLERHNNNNNNNNKKQEETKKPPKSNKEKKSKRRKWKRRPSIDPDAASFLAGYSVKDAKNIVQDENTHFSNEQNMKIADKSEDSNVQNIENDSVCSVHSRDKQSIDVPNTIKDNKQNMDLDCHITDNNKRNLEHTFLDEYIKSRTYNKQNYESQIQDDIIHQCKYVQQCTENKVK